MFYGTVFEMDMTTMDTDTIKSIEATSMLDIRAVERGITARLREAIFRSEEISKVLLKLRELLESVSKTGGSARVRFRNVKRRPSSMKMMNITIPDHLNLKLEGN